MQLSKLKWQCRRGTQELNQLLLIYLENDYFMANAIEQQQFEQLLALEDSQLLQLFLTTANSNQQSLNPLVEKIRHRSILLHS